MTVHVVTHFPSCTAVWQSRPPYLCCIWSGLWPCRPHSERGSSQSPSHPWHEVVVMSLHLAPPPLQRSRCIGSSYSAEAPPTQEEWVFRNINQQVTTKWVDIVREKKKQVLQKSRIINRKQKYTIILAFKLHFTCKISL